jgi:hypothetical protein
MIPMGEWSPDQPKYREPGLDVATNVMPREDGSYGPFPSLTSLSQALPSACRGFGTSRALAGSYLTFGATANDLFRLEATGNWTSLSRPGGYTLDERQRWRFAPFGSLFIAAGGVDTPIQVFDVETASQWSDLSATAPNAEHMATVGRSLMLGQTFDGTDEFMPNRVWWSAIGNPRGWPTTGTAEAATVQSGRVDLQDGGWIQGILPGIGGADAAVFGESRIWRVSYIGPPAIFQFDPVERARGCYAPGSIVGIGKLAYFLAEDGWYVFDGVQATPIGAGKIDRWFLNDLDDSSLHNMWTAQMPEQKTWICAYPGQNNIGGRANHCLLYNWAAQRFSYAEIEIEALGNIRSSGYTLDSLDSLGFTLDELPFSLDDRVWVGGAPIIAVADRQHMLAKPAGPNLQADFVTTDFIATDGDRVFLSGVQPFTDCENVLVAIGVKHNEHDEPLVTSYRAESKDRFAPFRHAGRRVEIRIRQPAGQPWTYSQGYKLRSRKEGRR